MKKLWGLCVFFPTMLMAADIFLAGDSTMANYPARRMPMTGWGMKLSSFCIDGVKIHNHAVGGTSSKTFREKYWDKLIAKVRPGDFVFIQFGHNDRSKRHNRFTDPATTFQDHLRFFIRQVRDKKATPVILTITPVCRFNKHGKMYNAKVHQNYIDAAIKVAADEKVDLINHNALLLADFGALGPEKAAKMYMNLAPGEAPNYPKGRKDNTHLRDTGAEIAAKLAVKSAKDQKLAVAELFK